MKIMKNFKIKNLVFYLSAVCLFSFFGCEEDIPVAISQIDFVSFEVPETSAIVTLNETGSKDIDVYASQTSDVERTFSIAVDTDATSADPLSYQVPASVTIPANTMKGTFTVEFADINIRNAGETLTVNFNNQDDVFLGEEILINIIRDCPSNLEGTYSVASTSSTLFGGTRPLDITYEVEIEKTGETSYTISDGFAGVWIEWGCVAYGACDELPKTFIDTCGILSTSGWGTGPFGFGTTLLEITDNFDGTLAVVWRNAWGDVVNAIYTKL